MRDRLVRVAGITKGSTVNGPGKRSVLHVQGCTLGCPGCFNTHTWNRQGGISMRVSEVVAELLQDNPKAEITISGGEPMQQKEEVIQVITLIKAIVSSSRILMFTGFYASELYEIDILLLENLQKSGLDAIVSGRYDRENEVYNSGLLSSSNQQVLLLTDAFSNEDLGGGPRQTEIIIEEDGQMKLSGFPNLRTINQLRRETIDVSIDGV